MHSNRVRRRSADRVVPFAAHREARPESPSSQMLVVPELEQVWGADSDAPSHGTKEIGRDYE